MAVQPEDINTRIALSYLRHMVFVERLQNGALKRFLKALLDTQKEIISVLSANYPGIPTGTDTFGALTQAQIARLNNINQQITVILEASKVTLEHAFRLELEEFAAREGPMLINLINGQIPPSTGIVLRFDPVSFADVERMINTPLGGMTYSERLARNYGDAVSRIKASLTDSLMRGETVKQATDRLKLVLGDALIHRTEPLVRTEFARVAIQTNLAAMRQNEDVLKGLVWLSSLNVNVCPICRRLHGRELPLDTKLKPPAHPNCVCVLSPSVKNYRDLGLTDEDIPDDLKYLFTGSPPELPLDFDEFLEMQPAAFQKQMLGPARYKLFKKGVSTKDMATDTRILTIDEIEQLSKAA